MHHDRLWAQYPMKTISVILALAWVSLLYAGGPTLKSELKDAHTQYKKKNYKAANQVFNDAQQMADEEQKRLSGKDYYVWGNALFALKKYKEAQDTYLTAVGARYKKSHFAFYNIACMLSRQNKVKEAKEFLIKAADMGYKPMRHMLKDKDLANVRRAGNFKKFHKSLVARSKKKNLRKITGCFMADGYRMLVMPNFVWFNGPMGGENYSATCHVKKLKASKKKYAINCKDKNKVNIKVKGKKLYISGYKVLKNKKFTVNQAPAICNEAEL